MAFPFVLVRASSPARGNELHTAAQDNAYYPHALVRDKIWHRERGPRQQRANTTAYAFWLAGELYMRSRTSVYYISIHIPHLSTMAYTQLFYAYRPLDNLPVELVAEISSQLDQDEENCICRDRKKPSKDLLNFALVSKRYGAVASRTLFRDVYGARNWDEHIPQGAGSDMEKLNLAPLHSAWELLLGTANPMSYIHSVTLAPPRGTQDTFFRVSPNKLREALLSLPCLQEVCFRQTEMLDDPVVVSGASSRLLTVSNVSISQLDGGVVGDETHLPRLLGIFDEIGTLDYSSDHSQITYEETPEPRRPRVKVSMLKFLPTRDGCPVGALKAINALVELSAMTEMRIVMQDWSNYLWCGKRLNEMIRGASNLQVLSLSTPQPLSTMQGTHMFH